MPLKLSSGETSAISVALSANFINDFSSILFVESIENFLPLNTLIPILNVSNTSIFYLQNFISKIE